MTLKMILMSALLRGCQMLKPSAKTLRISSAIELVQKAHDERQDIDMKMLQVFLKDLKRAETSSLKLEDVKDKVIKHKDP